MTMLLLIQAQPALQDAPGLYVMAVIAAFFIALLGGFRLVAGQGCLIFALIWMWMIAGTSLAWRGHFVACALIAGAGYWFAWSVHRRKEETEAEARRAKEAAEQEIERQRAEALRRQRALVPASAKLVGLVTYRGGLPEMSAGQVVELLAGAEELFLVPVKVANPAAMVDVSKSTHLWVAEAAGTVVLATDSATGWPQQVEFGPAEGGIANPRDLYARLARVLPARALSKPDRARAGAIPCPGCGAGIAADAPACRYCGRPA
ncbi:MAG TPA: zinc ribbon domain-containing protein [Longimicrobium sp.]|nr:zinc ribbon domain-containing protein [Longimicrobium sp.]